MANSKKKRNSTLILLLIAMIALLGTYGLLIKQKGNDENVDTDSETTEETTTIVSLDADTIASIYFKNETNEMTIEKSEDGHWVYKEDASFPVNQTYAGNMTTALSSVTSSRTITDNNDLSSFGLDSPSITIKAITKDGDITTISLGDEAPVAGGYYAMLNDGSEVYIVTSGFSSYFKYDLVKMTEIESIPSITAENITHLSVINNEKPSFEVLYDENNAADYAGITNWIIKQPYPTEVPGDVDALTTLMSNYSGMTFLTNVDYNATDLSKYGLDTPSSTITIDYYEVFTQESNESDGDDTVTSDSEETGTEEAEPITTTIEYTYELLIGGMDSEGNYYVKAKDSNAVHTMSADSVTNLTDIDVYSNTYKYINLVNIDSLGTVNAVINGVNYVMDVEKTTETVDSEETEITNYYFNGELAEEDKFKELYQTIIAPKTDREIPVDYVSNSNTLPVLTLSFEQKAIGRTITVEYLPYDESFYIVKADGISYFLTDIRKINEIVESLENFQSKLKASN